VHLSESARNIEGQVAEGCSRIAKLDVASEVGNDPFGILIFEFVIFSCSAGMLAESIDVFLPGRFRELAVLDAEVPDEPDLLDKRPHIGRDNNVRAEARSAIQGRLWFTDKQPKNVLDAAVMDVQLNGSRFAVLPGVTRNFALCQHTGLQEGSTYTFELNVAIGAVDEGM
jgi:hypothetical protein